MNFATWISEHGSLPIPQDAAAFGHAPGITFASAAFYQVGSNSSCPSSWPGCRCCSRSASGRAAPGSRCSSRRCSAHSACSRSAAWWPGWSVPAGRRSARWPSPSASPRRTSAATPTARRSRRSCCSARCRCGSTCSAPIAARKTPGGGGPTGGRTRGRPRTCSRGSPGCCSASPCSCASTGRPTSCSSSRTAACWSCGGSGRSSRWSPAWSSAWCTARSTDAFLTLPYLKTNKQSVEYHGRRVRPGHRGHRRGGLVATPARLRAALPRRSRGWSRP